MSFFKRAEIAFEKGYINKFFLKLISSQADESDDIIKEAILYSDIGIDSNSELDRMNLIRSCVFEITDSDNFEIASKVYSKANSHQSKNDIYASIVKEAMLSKDIKKFAYPTGTTGIIEESYDLERWIDVVHKIYDSVNKDQMTLRNALDYYSNSLDIKKSEDVNFRRWFNHYSSGEHLKYSNKKGKDEMRKKSVYTGGLLTHNYRHDMGNNSPGDSFVGRTFESAKVDSKNAVDTREGHRKWVISLDKALRVVDRLIRDRSKCTPAQYRGLAKTLMDLSVQVSELQPITAYDMTYRAANKLKKQGFEEEAAILKAAANEGSNLIKLAQEVPQQQAPEQVAAPASPEAAIATPPEAEVAEEEEGQSSPIPGPDEVEPAKLEDITPIPGPEESDYDKLAGALDLADASEKLDQAAGMLADRRVIRLLAEFDIMLDKLGIASMFPELAESQAKLIDAFGYALTRVTKMMGQLSNAETLVSSQSGIPGAQTEEASPEPGGEVSEIEGAPSLEQSEI